MSDEILLLARAFNFAAQRHTRQQRKGRIKEPYINHLAEVACLLAEATDGRDPNLVAAGLLHDTVEDQKVKRAELEKIFGGDVAGLVIEVTDDKSLHKATRKRLQVETAPHKSNRAKMLKIADKTSNLRALLASPPAKWPLKRKQKYIRWAKAVIDGCRGVSSKLEADFDRAYAEGVKAFDLNEAGPVRRPRRRSVRVPPSRSPRRPHRRSATSRRGAP